MWKCREEEREGEREEERDGGRERRREGGREGRRKGWRKNKEEQVRMVERILHSRKLSRVKTFTN